MKLISIAVVATALFLTTNSAYAQCVPEEFPDDWLYTQEALGGHTIALHVDRTDAELVQRLINSPRITASSAYYDYDSAMDAIATIMTDNEVQLNEWAEQANYGDREVFEGHLVYDVGRVAFRPPNLGNVWDSDEIRGVLVADGDGGCFLLTSFPI